LPGKDDYLSLPKVTYWNLTIPFSGPLRLRLEVDNKGLPAVAISRVLAQKLGDQLTGRTRIAESDRRCKGCNSRINKGDDFIDPKRERCNKCYLIMVNPEELTIKVEIYTKKENSSAKEIIEYIESFLNYTSDIQGYGMKVERS
jgi:hypothetical protein